MSSNRITILGATLAAATLGTSLVGCGGDTQGPLDGIDSIVFLQRPARNDMGDIFQYNSYIPGARLVKLSPPTADGELTVICCDQDADYADLDISGYDLSFDAERIVFSGRRGADQNYGLFQLTLADGKVEQLSTDPNRDYVQPIYLPGDKILFMTNTNVEEGAPQHRDEYERGTTLQLGVMNDDGTGQVLGPKNLSHRVHPSLMADGRVLFTQWDHLGEENSGHLMKVNPDLTVLREAFGKEGTGVTNSYLKAREIAPGRVIAIGTARNRTIQAGTLLDIRLGMADGKGGFTTDESEANASYRILTPNVPRDNEPSSQSVGRYYDAYPLDAADYPTLLVSWADGPVESGTLEAAGLAADFGIYLYDSKSQQRRPIWDEPDTWDIFPRPLVPREAPPKIDASGKNEFNPDATLIGSMNVYRSSLDTFEPGSLYGVRVIEGFSTEEGIPRMFGLTRHEGAAVLGVAPVQEDGSWAALIPANVPVHLQPIDVYGMSARSEPVWFSGAHGESRFCGGCHESRTDTTVIQPGLTQAIAAGPTDLMADTPRFDRVSSAYTRDGAVGVPWDTALQPIFDAKCVSCHDGTPGAANPSWTISDPETGATFTWTFNLSGGAASYGVGTEMFSGYSASHLSLMGPEMMDLENAGLVVTGELPIYVEPGNARGSKLIQKLNPVRQFPTQDGSQRAFDTAQFPAHAAAVGQELTPDEYYLLILMADNGGQFYSRENAPQ
ncbi:MAG: hypothetical protein H6709_15900 [Kofleriaceae bacterium]|nr:hypothetical protein [Myxococcales bacterium]MCB9573562.1 hypothetical protein [Kofleriaceae bacterium]